MFKGEVEVAWCVPVQDGEVVIALRVPSPAGLANVKAGDRLELTATRPTATKRPGIKTRAQHALSGLAGRWCRDATFQEWASTTFPEDYSLVRSNQPANGVTEKDRETAVAAALVRKVCAVASRLDLDHCEPAANLFHRFIRVPYSQWLQSRYPNEFQRLQDCQ